MWAFYNNPEEDAVIPILQMKKLKHKWSILIKVTYLVSSITKIASQTMQPIVLLVFIQKIPLEGGLN